LIYSTILDEKYFLKNDFPLIIDAFFFHRSKDDTQEETQSFFRIKITYNKKQRRNQNGIYMEQFKVPPLWDGD
jgi:hypothetical protein